MQVTRYSALGAALTLVDANIRVISENWTKLMPRMGCEAQWDFLREVEQHLQAMMIENRPVDELRKNAKQKKGAMRHDEAGVNTGTVGQLGGQINSSEPHAGAMACTSGDCGSDCGLHGGPDASAGVLELAVKLPDSQSIQPLSPREIAEAQGMPQLEKPPLNDRLESIMRRETPAHIKQMQQPPWAMAAMEKAARDAEEVKDEGQVSFI